MTNQNRKENEQESIGIARLLSPKDVAEILGISVKTVHKLVRDGKLGCVQVTSKERRFTEEQVEGYIRSKIQPVRIDKDLPTPVFSPRRGGERSLGVSKADLRKEMRQWQ